jgi:hypothetical protein
MANKYNISANSIVELLMQVADVVRRTEVLTVKDRSKGNGQYALWNMEIPLSNKNYTLKAGIPTNLKFSVVYGNLVAASEFDSVVKNREAKEATRKAATVSSITDIGVLEARLAELKAQAAGKPTTTTAAN